MQGKKIKIIIVILAVLLAVSAVGLAATLLYNHFAQSEPVSVEVPDNIITPDDEKDSAANQNSAEPSNSETNAESDASASPDQSNESEPNSSGSNSSVSQPSESSSESGTKASAISLHNEQPEDNEPFAVENMFPGDVETKYYRIKVSYKGDIVVRFHADIRSGYEKLAEVLKVRVKLLGEEKLLYDGLMRDMPESLNHALYTTEKTQSELYYEITAYLDTSVGNEYMDKDLVADFRWWVQETQNLDSPQTGDNSNILLWAVLGCSSLLCMIILLAKRRKETANEY